jgi:uncharacterized membrane protein YphA (DoxX/SURF4 family)
MENFIFKMKMYSPAFLRIGMAIVVIWFGSQELMYPDMWTSFIPQSVVNMSHMNANLLVHINGSFEIVFGLALLLGIQTRLTALLLALHMLDITYIVGYNAVGVRDFGLSIALISIFMYGQSLLSINNLLKKQAE